jgi:HEAT repeat protein
LAFHLGELKVSQAGEPLIELLQNDIAEARRHAVMSLQNINYRRAIPSLQKALNDEDAGVRERAQQALRFFGENAVAPFSYINGCIVRYPDLEQAQKDVDWLVDDLATRLPSADFDVGIAEVEDKDAYVVIVTSNDPDIRQVFRVEIYPKLSGKESDTEWRGLEFSNEQKLPFYLGQGGRLLMHRYRPHAGSASA